MVTNFHLYYLLYPDSVILCVRGSSEDMIPEGVFEDSAC